MKKDFDANDVFQKYLNGHASQEEVQILESWLLSYPIRDRQVLGKKEMDTDLTEVRIHLVQLSHRRGTSWKLWSVVTSAAILLFISAIISLRKPNYQFSANENMVVLKEDFKPGKNAATLTLSNGQVISLSDQKTGVVINHSKMTYDDGSSLEGISSNKPVQMVQAATPRGGQYSLTLSDGTKVWLNAASHLKFPSTFAHADKRKVELIGEAYFEVAKDAAHPFQVQSAGQTVQVLGTHFNINAYEDENDVRTTLTEGSIKLNEVLLKPGQQGRLKDGKIKITKADLQEVMAWRNGLFVFNDESLELIMRKISRWYDVEIRYQGVDPKMSFWGDIPCNENISKILEMLTATGKIRFKAEGRIIIVLPKE